MKLPLIDSISLQNKFPGPDCVLFTAPFSPNDSGPPLGPAILRGRAAQSGYDVRCVDSNVRYLNLFREGPMTLTPFVGDQDKDQVTNRRAREHFRRSLCLGHISPKIVADPIAEVMGLQCSFEEIEVALDQMIDDGFWVEFLEEHLFKAFEQPRVLGLSLMGPAQVMVALLAARLCRASWPETAVIAGGSHITLLSERIEADSRYGTHIDAFLPGHSEHTFVDLLGMELPYYYIPGVLVSDMTFMPTCTLPPSEWEPPSFEESELRHYPIERLTLPIQLRRGCLYGKCTYCTYPKVEELTQNDVTEMARRLLPALLEHGPERISVKDSLFDLKAMRDFSEVMAEIAPRVAWSCTTKLVRGMRKESMLELYKKGLRTVEFGIESIHEHTQRLFDKVQPVDQVEEIVDGACEAGITVVLNLIYGAPGETHEDAMSQLKWFLEMSEKWPLNILGSHNLLEVNLGSPLAEMEWLEASMTGPWAFSMAWDAPDWRPQFLTEMVRLGLIQPLVKYRRARSIVRVPVGGKAGLEAN